MFFTQKISGDERKDEGSGGDPGVESQEAPLHSRNRDYPDRGTHCPSVSSLPK